MEYNEFKANLQKRIQSEYEEAHIYTETIEKNNGIKKERLVIHEKGERAVPGIYLRELYECYKETGDMELCVQMVKQLTEKREKMPVYDRDILGKWEECRERIMLRLVCRKWNRELLKTVPYQKFLDLAVTFHLLLEKTEDDIYSTPITNKIMAVWGISADELFQTGMKNLNEKNSFKINSIDQFALQILKEEPDVYGVHMPKEGKPENGMEEGKRPYHTLLEKIYVMYKTPYCFGSTGMLATTKLKELAEKEGDFYIIPMSVHELLLIPKSKMLSVDELKNMVVQANRKSLFPEERLSDSVYCFSRESGRMEIAEE